MKQTFDEPITNFQVTASCPGFKCADGKQCLPRHDWYCDGKADCNDKSDELHCAPHCELAEGSFLCKSEDECVAIEKVCDGKDDCSDKSDEGENCKNSAAACSSLKCDGECKLLPTGPTCVCEKGFTFNAANKKCEVSWTAGLLVGYQIEVLLLCVVSSRIHLNAIAMLFALKAAKTSKEATNAHVPQIFA